MNLKIGKGCLSVSLSLWLPGRPCNTWSIDFHHLITSTLLFSSPLVINKNNRVFEQTFCKIWSIILINKERLFSRFSIRIIIITPRIYYMQAHLSTTIKRMLYILSTAQSTTICTISCWHCMYDIWNLTVFLSYFWSF